MYYNKQLMAGNVGNDIELTYVGDEGATAMARVSIAYNDYRKKGQPDETTWSRWTFFGNQAESIANHVKKGDNIFVEGAVEAPYAYTDKKTNEPGASLQYRGFSWSYAGRKQDSDSDDSSTTDDAVAI